LVDVLAQSAHDSGDEADDGSHPDANVASCGSDSNEPSDGAFTSSDDAEAAVVLDVVDHDPADHAGASGGVGVEGGEHGAHGGVEGGSSLIIGQYDFNQIKYRVRTLKPNQPIERVSHASQVETRGAMRLPNQIRTVPRNTNVVLCAFPWLFSPTCLRFPSTKA
jgi:hypothetical protein